MIKNSIYFNPYTRMIFFKIYNTCTEECVLAASVPNPMSFYYE